MPDGNCHQEQGSLILTTQDPPLVFTNGGFLIYRFSKKYRGDHWSPAGTMLYGSNGRAMLAPTIVLIRYLSNYY